MRPNPAGTTGRIRPSALWWLLLAALACQSPTGEGRVRRLEVSAPATVLRPGFQMRVAAIAFDAAGEVVTDYPVTWRSLTPATLDVSPDGLLQARKPGVGIARASAGGVSATLELSLENPPVAQLALDADTLRLALPGAARALTAIVRDAEGLDIFGEALLWQSTADRIATVSPSGVVTPVAVGRATVSVRVGDRLARTAVIVDAPPTATSPVVASVSPSVVRPGDVVVVSGTGFAATAGANAALIDGTPVAVTAASATQLTLQLPDAPAFPCVAPGPVALQVNVGSSIGVGQVVLDAAPRRALAVGEAAILPSAASARCTALPAGPARYLVTLANGARALGSGPIAATLRGEAAASTGAALADAALVAERNRAAVAAPRRAPADLRRWLGDRRARARAIQHLRLHEANRALGLPVVRAESQLRAGGGASAVPAVGAILALRVPALDLPNFCGVHAPVGARVVHVTEHFVLLEDTLSVLDGAPTLARQMDADYVALGDQLEARGWPALQAFGQMLVMDDRLDANGRVMLVFTPRMNVMRGGAVLAAVVNCDFYPRAQFASSNVGEYVYAQVPTSLDDGMGDGTRARWRHELPGTLVHELKHVTSYAERIVRGMPLEEQWLEEATARHAEERFGRVAYGYARYGNVDFAAALACELRANDPAYPACAEAPRAVRPHLEALWEFLDAPDARSPLGPVDAADVSFYGSAWALTRWVADQEQLDEATFFGALTTSRQSGIANLEGRSGRSWDEIVTTWPLAMAADDRPGLVTASPRLRFPAFDLRSQFQGFCDVLGSCLGGSGTRFPRAWPVRPLALEAGPFSAEFGAIAPAGFVAVELAVPAGVGTAVLEVQGYRGAPLPAGARLAILRVE